MNKSVLIPNSIRIDSMNDVLCAPHELMACAPCLFYIVYTAIMAHPMKTMAMLFFLWHHMEGTIFFHG
ncbi:hypothetical protein XELAEV_18030603mg [Xenopus laevis]|uniref:Uncharacterized protein n=1 Tax=Xenopus laevis TaxID=8355 RepID=A0A974HEZ4_XENLA|nr:hypothetical protein XELAEV_18030603mg [Xenopus laevis]